MAVLLFCAPPHARQLHPVRQACATFAHTTAWRLLGASSPGLQHMALTQDHAASLTGACCVPAAQAPDRRTQLNPADPIWEAETDSDRALLARCEDKIREVVQASPNRIRQEGAPTEKRRKRLSRLPARVQDEVGLVSSPPPPPPPMVAAVPSLIPVSQDGSEPPVCVSPVWPQLAHACHKPGTAAGQNAKHSVAAWGHSLCAAESCCRLSVWAATCQIQTQVPQAPATAAGQVNLLAPTIIPAAAPSCIGNCLQIMPCWNTAHLA